MTQVTLLHGHCLEQMATLKASSVHCCVTSPPYWGLRDYGSEPVDWPVIAYAPMVGLPACVEIPAMRCSLGLEPTFDAFIGHLVLVFRDVRRVLRKDGTLWLNMGDSYAGSGKGGNSGASTTHTAQHDHAKRAADVVSDSQRVRCPAAQGPRAKGSHKAKDLIGQPWRLALALQADGWWLRCDIVWHKLNPMPESCGDRPTRAHEYVFLLSKSERYWYNAEAVKEPVSPNTHLRYALNGGAPPRGSSRGFGAEPRDAVGLSVHKASNGYEKGDRRPKAWDVDMGSNRTLVDGFERTTPKAKVADVRPKPRTKNNANFGAALRGEQPSMRNARTVWTLATEPYAEAHFATFPTAVPRRAILAGCHVGGTVLDPFNGSGTTGEVALQLGRAYVGIEIKAEYLELTRQRLAALTLGLPLEVANAEAR